MHNFFRGIFPPQQTVPTYVPDKVIVNEETGEITLSGETLPYPKDMWVGLTKCDKKK